MRRVTLHEGVKVTISANVKDELVLEGESLDNVSQSAASIQQICNVRNKEYCPFLLSAWIPIPLALMRSCCSSFALLSSINAAVGFVCDTDW